MRVLVMAMSVMMTNAAMADGFGERFDQLDLSRWTVAQYEFKHPSFDTDWNRSQVQVDQGLMLQLDPQAGRENRFVGGSIRTHATHHYGRFEAVMQPARGAGVVTGFFTYTGPHYGTRHDEIDIEFLGKNTNQIHLATFVDGKLWNKFIDLPFDASDAPRTYAFEWDADAVRWYVEGQMIYERRAADGAIPSLPGQVYANLWAADPSIKSWSGLARQGISAHAKVTAINVTALVTPDS